MNRIRLLRQQRNLTQDELGNIVNVQKSAISKYELGRAVPSPEVLTKLSDFFGVSIDYILGHSPSEVVKKASSPSFNISPEEILHIKKYRTLDDVGKNVVDAVLETQIQRIAEKQGLSSDKAI